MCNISVIKLIKFTYGLKFYGKYQCECDDLKNTLRFIMGYID